jgi:hypothetical protein
MLIPNDLLNTLPALYEQDGLKDPMVHLKFFNPVGGQSWFLMEYDPEDSLAFGWVDLGNGMPELGYFSIEELESIKLPYYQKIERDEYFQTQLLSKVKESS